MIKLLDLIKEYGNQGPTSPEVYKLIPPSEEIIPSSMGEIKKIPNLIYDMGGGETSFYDESNVVIIDNMDEHEVLNGIIDNSNVKEKLYIKYNLEKSSSFPLSNKIIISQLVYHLTNSEALAETVNNSIKPNGTIQFKSDVVTAKDKKFIENLKKLGFHTHKFEEEDEGGVLYLKKLKPKNKIITPFDREYKKPKTKWWFKDYKGEIHNFKNGKELQNYFTLYAEGLFRKYPYFYIKRFEFGKDTGEWIKRTLDQYYPWFKESEKKKYGMSPYMLPADMEKAYDKNKKSFDIFRNHEFSHDPYKFFKF